MGSGNVREVAVVVHNEPDLDELFAYVLLKKYGRYAFGPGAQDARLLFFSELRRRNGDYKDTGKGTLYVLLGCGGGQFDEHALESTCGGTRTCAAVLLAEYLKVDKRLEIRDLLRQVRKADSEGDDGMLALGSVVKAMYESFDQDYVIGFAVNGLRALCNRKMIREECAMHIPNVILSEEIEAQGRTFRIGLVAHDYRGPGNTKGFDIVAVRRQEKNLGNVQVYLNNPDLDLTEVASRLRLREFCKRLSRPQPGEDEEIVTRSRTVGSDPLMGLWNFFVSDKYQNVTNGNNRYQDVEPTKLSDREIFAALRAGLCTKE